MICPHCGKDSDLVYPDPEGGGINKAQAEIRLAENLKRLDALEAAGAYSAERSMALPKTRLEEQYDKVLEECSDLEVALGL